MPSNKASNKNPQTLLVYLRMICIALLFRTEHTNGEVGIYIMNFFRVNGYLNDYVYSTFGRSRRRAVSKPNWAALQISSAKMSSSG